MPNVTLTWNNVTQARVDEIREALAFHTGADPADIGIPELRAWVQKQVRGLTLKHRESQQAPIDTTDPLA